MRQPLPPLRLTRRGEAALGVLLGVTAVLALAVSYFTSG